MTGDTFDPFDLPSAFDPFADAAGAPPSRRRRQVITKPATAPPPRLAHLLAEAASAAPPGTGATTNVTDTATRLATLEDEIALLTARLDALQAAVDHKLDSQRAQLLRAVGSLMDERLGRR